MTIDTCQLTFSHDTELPAQGIETENILAVLNRARGVEDMNLPGFRLHPLKGELAGFHAVIVRANYRVTFRFDKGDAFDVDFIDYHLDSGG